MGIEVRINAENAEELAKAAVTLAFLFSPDLRAGVARAAAPEPVEAEQQTSEPKPRRGRRGANPTIDHDPNEGKPDASTTASADSATGTGEGAEGTGSAEAASTDGSAGVDAVAEVDRAPAEPPAPSMTVDELRSYVITKYLNAHFTEQADKSAAFKAMLTEFGLEKIGDTPADKIDALKAYADAKIAEHAGGKSEDFA